MEQQQKKSSMKNLICSDDQQITGTWDEFETVVNKSRLIECCLQGLFLESSVNWAHDPNLFHLIINLGVCLEENP